MKKIFLLAGVLCAFSCATAQFPGTDSLHRYNNRYIRNSPLEAFNNLRLNTLIHGIIQWIDSARAGAGGALGIDTAFAVNDSTFRYKKNGNNYTVVMKGIYDVRRKVDSGYVYNDSIIRLIINGSNRDFLLRGKDVRKLTDSTIKIGPDTMKVSGTFVGGGGGPVNTKNPITKVGDSVAITLNQHSATTKQNELTTKAQVFNSFDELRSIPDAAIDSNFIYNLQRPGDIDAWKYDPTDNTTPDDTATVVVTTDGKRIKRDIAGTIYVDWFGAVGNGTTDDSYAFQKMIDWIAVNATGRSFNVRFKKRHYRIESPIIFPVTFGTDQHTELTFDGNGVKLSTTQAISIFSRVPVNNSTTGISNYRLEIKGIRFEGNLTTGQIGVNIAGQYGANIHDNEFAALDTGMVARFWLGGTIERNFFSGNKSAGLVGSSGQGFWTGGDVTNSAFNAVRIVGNRVFNAVGSYAAFINYGGDKVIYDANISEGAKPVYHYVLDRQGSTLVNETHIKNAWIESGGAGACTVFYFKTGGITSIESLQRIHADTLFKLETPGANSVIIFDKLPYLSVLPSRPFNALGITNNTTDIYVTGNIVDAGMFSDTSKWVGGVLGAHIHIDAFRSSATTLSYRSSLPIILEPAYQALSNARNLRIRGNVTAVEDNLYALGWSSIGAFRFYQGVFGTGGVNIDLTAGFKWLNTLGTASDLVLSRDASGILEIESAFAMLPPMGTTAQRSGATKNGSFRINIDSLHTPEYQGNFQWYLLASRKWTRDNFLSNQVTASSTTTDSAAVIDRTTNQLVMRPVSGGGGIGSVNPSSSPTDSAVVINRTTNQLEMRPIAGGAGGASGDGTINGTTNTFERLNFIDDNGDKFILSSTILHHIIIRSSVGLANLKIGTTNGGSEIWSGAVTADDVNHANDINLQLGTWFPNATTLYFTGIDATGADVKIYLLTDKWNAPVAP